MQSIGTKATIRTAGVPNAAKPATDPRADARLYAGAVDAIPMQILEKKEIASFFKPLALTTMTWAEPADEAFSTPLSFQTYACKRRPPGPAGTGHPKRDC